MAKIMLADDEESIRNVVKSILAGTGHEFVYACDGAEALEVVKREQPDLVILDIMMPKMDGFDVCAALRRQGSGMPIIFLSAKSDIVDKGVGFKLGADDYLVKPFEPRELLFRIEALLRRSQPTVATTEPSSEIIEYEGFRMDTVRRRVTIDGEEIALTPKEYHLLKILASHQGEVFKRDRLIEDVWGPEYVGTSTSITVIVRRIRAKIEKNPSDPRYLQTVWHVGYRFGD